MDKYYVIIAGKGTTSRPNVEALIEDYVYANGPDVTFLLAYDKAPSQGQTFIGQWAKDKSKEIMVFANEGAKYDGIPSASMTETDTPLETVCKSIKNTDKVVAFLLWDDEDAESSVNLSYVCHKYAVKCYDLTDGLNDVTTTKAKPISDSYENMPEVETKTTQAPVEEDDEDDEEGDEDEEDLDDDEPETEEELMDDIYFGIQSLVKAISKAVVAELQNALKKPSEGPEA
jgi:hypothetical protein